jgi:hypothetical protein
VLANLRGELSAIKRLVRLSEQRVELAPQTLPHLLVCKRIPVGMVFREYQSAGALE